MFTNEQLERINKVPELCRINADGFLELYANNSILSSLRKCEAYFVERYLNHRVPIGQSNWNLEFGSWLHATIEYLYKKIYNKESISSLEFLEYGTMTWAELEIDNFKSDKRYIDFGGLKGALVILKQFYEIWHTDNTNIIAIETGFGYGKEVPIISPTNPSDRFFPFNAYLCGRPDVIVHNGHNIGVLDWKTTAYFDGYEHTKYKPYDALAGYIYAMNHIIRTKYPDLLKAGLTVDTAWVICISKRVTSTTQNRFTKFPVKYTPSELHEYRNRQIETFVRMYDIIVNNRAPQWDTSHCNNDYYRPCTFKILHELPPEHREMVLNGRFTIDTSYKPDNTESILAKTSTE